MDVWRRDGLDGLDSRPRVCTCAIITPNPAPSSLLLYRLAANHAKLNGLRHERPSGTVPEYPE